MQISFWPTKEKEPRKILATIARSNKLTTPQTKRFFEWIFTQNKNPDLGQLRKLIDQYKP